MKRLQKFNLKDIQQYAKESDLSGINQTMLTILISMVNEYLSAIEKEGVLTEYTTREGLKRVKNNQLIDNVIPTFSMISKILKDNNLVVAKKNVDEQTDEFNQLINNIITGKEEDVNK